MDLVSTLAPPRLCQLDGEIYWVRPLTLGDYAVILAWLDDVLPGKPDRQTPPLMSSPEAQRALDAWKGTELLIWLALREQGTNWLQCQAIAQAVHVNPVERIPFYEAIYARRRTRSFDRPGGEDLAEAWVGPLVAAMAERFGYTLNEISKLTLDQVECLNSDGLPSEDPRQVTHEELARYDALARANREAKERQPDMPSGFEMALAEAVERLEAARAEPADGGPT